MERVFISYSRANLDFALHLQKLLQTEGIQTWLDQNAIEPSDEWEKEIQAGIEGSAALIVVMSLESYQSEWVHKEVKMAQRLHRPIFPILLSGNIWKELQHIHITRMETGTTTPELPQMLRNSLLKVIGRDAASPSRRMVWMVASLGVILLLLVGALFVLNNLLAQSNKPTATPADSALISTVTANPPTATSATAAVMASPETPTQTPEQSPTPIPIIGSTITVDSLKTWTENQHYTTQRILSGIAIAHNSYLQSLSLPDLRAADLCYYADGIDGTFETAARSLGYNKNVFALVLTAPRGLTFDAVESRLPANKFTEVGFDLIEGLTGQQYLTLLLATDTSLTSGCINASIP